MGSYDYRYHRRRDFNSSAYKGNLFQFFIKPKLCIEFDNNNITEFLQQLRLLVDNRISGVTRTWIKVRVRNTGRATANNCKAKLRVLDGSSQVRPHDTKRLIWDDFADSVDIYPEDEGEFCHVAFSDDNFRGDIVALIASEQC